MYKYREVCRVVPNSTSTTSCMAMGPAVFSIPWENPRYCPLPSPPPPPPPPSPSLSLLYSGMAGSVCTELYYSAIDEQLLSIFSMKLFVYAIAIVYYDIIYMCVIWFA